MKTTTARTPLVKPLSYRVEASEARLTGYGGVGLLASFVNQLQVPEMLAGLPALPSTRRYPAWSYLLGMFYGLTLDRSRQQHIAELGEDPVFLALTGLGGMARQSSLSRFGKRVRMPTVHALLEANRQLVARMRGGFAERDTLTLDFDSHTQTTLGRPQRAAVGYNRRRPGAQRATDRCSPSSARLATLWAGAFGRATRTTSKGPRHSSTSCVVGCAGLAFAASWAFGATMASMRAGSCSLRSQARSPRLRSGRSNTSFLDHLERWQTTYAVVADLAGLGLRLVGLQHRLLDDEYAVAEFRHRAAGWKRARRMIAIRRRLDPKEPKRGKQLRLLEAEGYSWQVIVTNCPDPPEAVWRHYNGRCNVENPIEEGRLGFSMDEVCSHNYAANRDYA